MNPRVAVCLTPVVAVGVIGAIAARAPQPKQRGDAVAEEVRQLRLAVDRAAEISARAGLVVQRSNLVQARLSTLSWELADIRSQLVRASSEVARYTAVVDDYERQFPEIAGDSSIALRMPVFLEGLQGASVRVLRRGHLRRGLHRSSWLESLALCFRTSRGRGWQRRTLDFA